MCAARFGAAYHGGDLVLPQCGYQLLVTDIVLVDINRAPLAGVVATNGNNTQPRAPFEVLLPHRYCGGLADYLCCALFFPITRATRFNDVCPMGDITALEQVVESLCK